MKEKSSMAAAICKTIMMMMGLLYLQSLTTADLIATPKDSEALNGTLTFFNCSSTLPASSIHWFHYDIGTQDDRYIVYGYDQIHGSFQNRFRVERDDAARKSNLVIERVSAADAGKFECQDDMGRGASGFAQLSVLGAKPVCEWKIDNQQLSDSGDEGMKSDKFLHLKCTVDFRGNNPPKMIWKRLGSNEAITEGITVIRDSTTQITYRLDMEANHEFNGQSFQCETTKSVTTQLACHAGPVVIEANTGDFSKGSAEKTALIVVLVIGWTLAIVLLALLIFWMKRKRDVPGSEKDQDHLSPQETDKLMSRNTGSTDSQVEHSKNSVSTQSVSPTNGTSQTSNSSFNGEQKKEKEESKQKKKPVGPPSVSSIPETLGKDESSVTGDFKEKEEKKKSPGVEMHADSEDQSFAFPKVKDLAQLYDKKDRH